MKQYNYGILITPFYRPSGTVYRVFIPGYASAFQGASREEAEKYADQLQDCIDHLYNHSFSSQHINDEDNLFFVIGAHLRAVGVDFVEASETGSDMKIVVSGFRHIYDFTHFNGNPHRPKPVYMNASQYLFNLMAVEGSCFYTFLCGVGDMATRDRERGTFEAIIERNTEARFISRIEEVEEVLQGVVV